MSMSKVTQLAEVVHRERQLLNPVVRADFDRVQELLHPDFVEYGASGRSWDRAAIIAALVAEPDVSGEAVDFSAAALATTVVLVTYRIDGIAGSLRSSVWVHDPPSGWRLRFHQGTRISSPV
jgi:ribonuclease HI